MTSLNPHIFRAYDIRGKAGTDITEEVCRKIGQAFGTVLRERYKIDHPRIVVGWDARTHSPGFAKAVTEGLMLTGCSVLSMGETPSPVNYFTIVKRGLDAGIQITASHNASEDNGLKLQIRKAEPFSGDDLQMLFQRIERKEFLSGKGSLEKIDALTPYAEHYAKLFEGAGKGLSIVTDCGNGVAGPLYNSLLRRIGCTLTELYGEPDGTFPHHLADPSKWETLKDLQNTVRDTHAEGGLAFDGDGDRVGLVDEQGTIRTADEILLLLAKHTLKRHPGASIVFTVSMSSILETEIRRWGGQPIMCAVGHSVVELEMHKRGSPLGGEQSGHFFLEDIAHGYDDALAVALQLLAILREEGKPFSRVFAEFPQVYHAPERRPACPDSEKTRIIREVTGHFAQSFPVNTMDGARIDFGEGAWGNIRQSNTSPKLSICLEARSPEKLKQVENIVLRYLREFPEIGWD